MTVTRVGGRSSLLGGGRRRGSGRQSRGPSANLQVGRKAFAIGNPFGLDRTLTTRVISGRGRDLESAAGLTIRDGTRTDAAIGPGKPFGPLLDSAGRLIGVNAASGPSLARHGTFAAVPESNTAYDHALGDMKLERAGTADIEFELSWRSPEAAHAERYLAPRASLWRDCFRPAFASRLLGAAAGDEVVAEYAAGEAVPPWSERALVELRAESVGDGVGPERVPLRFGRFYPAGLLSGVTTFFAQDLRPARVVETGGARVVLDLNHPLARLPLRLRARVVRISPPGGKRSSACHDWLEEAAGGGPGLQARCGGRPTDFSDPDAFEREDASDDIRFYAAPRLVGHVDACAAAILREEHARRIPAGSRVLDLMSSAVSHLPGGRGLAIDGLGLNREELDANPLLRGRIVHDLNRNPSIPAGDRSYGAVVCSLSWEYLTSPDRVLREAARVLAPGGLLLIGLSNRWFPPKVTRLWERLHEFERVGLVLGQVLDGGGFRALETLSARNWPRPEDDRHAAQLRTADSVHLVAAVREG